MVTAFFRSLLDGTLGHGGRAARRATCRRASKETTFGRVKCGLRVICIFWRAGVTCAEITGMISGLTGALSVLSWRISALIPCEVCTCFCTSPLSFVLASAKRL